MTNAERKIRQALEKVGLQINDIYDLVNTSNPYPEAIPVLIDLLKEGIVHDGIKEGVIRALGVKEARGKAGKCLMEEFHKTPKEKSLLRWAIGNTMEIVISDEDAPDVLNIVKNKQNGLSRQMFVVALGNVQSELAEDVLISLLDDDEVLPHALLALGRIKSVKAKDKISKLINHPKPLVKKEAKNALKKIGSLLDNHT